MLEIHNFRRILSYKNDFKRFKAKQNLKNYGFMMQIQDMDQNKTMKTSFDKL